MGNFVSIPGNEGTLPSCYEQSVSCIAEKHNETITKTEENELDSLHAAAIAVYRIDEYRRRRWGAGEGWAFSGGADESEKARMMYD